MFSYAKQVAPLGACVNTNPKTGLQFALFLTICIHSVCERA